MRRPDLEGLPAVQAPEGYAFRTYEPGDEVHWCRIMEGSIGQGWTVERCRESLTDTPQFDPEGLFFATHQGAPIGSACAWKDSPEEKRAGVVHMVAVLKQHRGRRLGYWLSLLALHHLHQRGFTEAYLLTDDWRLSAIKAYLDLGFQPVWVDDSHRQRWEAVGERLGRAICVGGDESVGAVGSCP